MQPRRVRRSDHFKIIIAKKVCPTWDTNENAIRQRSQLHRGSICRVHESGANNQSDLDRWPPQNSGAGTTAEQNTTHPAACVLLPTNALLGSILGRSNGCVQFHS